VLASLVNGAFMCFFFLFCCLLRNVSNTDDLLLMKYMHCASPFFIKKGNVLLMLDKC